MTEFKGERITEPFQPPFLHPLLRVLLFLMASFTCAVFGSLPAVFALLLRHGEAGLKQLMEGNINDPLILLLMLGQFIAIIPALLLFCHFLDRRPFHTLGIYWHRKALTQLVLGTTFALAEWLFVIGALALTGHIRAVRFVGNLPPTLFIAYLMGFLVQGGVEELSMRGYILQNLLTRFSAATAVLGTSVLFSLSHAFNPGFFNAPSTMLLAMVNLTLYGILTGVSYLRFGSLWFAIGNHAAWNFALGNLFGMKVSGMQLPHYLWAVETQGAAWLTGGAFGIEGSLPGTFALLSLILVLLRLPFPQPPLQWWQKVAARRAILPNCRNSE